MKKLFIAATCALLSAAMAVPAFADHKIGGYFRTQMVMEQLAIGKDLKPAKGVDNRFRAKWVNTLNEYVSTTLYVEVDTPWGEQSKGAVGSGGQINADGVNIETKNVFLDLKIPETPVAIRLGVQGIGDNYSDVLFDNDMAGAKITAKLGMADVTAFWSKWKENTRTGEDDVDFYGLGANVAATEMLSVGGDIYYQNDQPNDETDYYLGVHGDLKLDMVALNAWFLYNGGTNESGPKDVDTSAFAASLGAKASLDAVKVGGRLMYFSPDDDADDNNVLDFDPGTGFEFYSEGLMIFLADIYYNNFGGGRHAMSDAALAGYGLFGLVANASATLPNAMYVKGAAGYFMAADDERNDEANKSREGTQLGLEVAAQVGIKVAEKADVSLRGAYALLGDFYDAAAGGKDPDDLYKLILMVNVPY